jgi:GTP-binding protein
MVSFNVGKSSLINAVLNRKGIARVSQTREDAGDSVLPVNERFYLVDLPGYGYAKVPKSVVSTWGELMRSYLENAADLKTIFLLLDIRREPGEHDLAMHGWARALESVNEKIVLTKSDKLSNNQIAQQRRAIAKQLQMDDEDLITTSVVSRKGIDEIRREMIARL